MGALQPALHFISWSCKIELGENAQAPVLKICILGKENASLLLLFTKKQHRNIRSGPKSANWMQTECYQFFHTSTMYEIYGLKKGLTSFIFLIIPLMRLIKGY
jgi:hypothetical protein